jgi:cell division protein FtsZ
VPPVSDTKPSRDASEDTHDVQRPVAVPRPAPEPPTPITSRVADPGRRRQVVFEDPEEELDVPDFLK